LADEAHARYVQDKMATVELMEEEEDEFMSQAAEEVEAAYYKQKSDEVEAEAEDELFSQAADEAEANHYKRTVDKCDAGQCSCWVYASSPKVFKGEAAFG
jgi:hypothetical protein